MSAFTASRGLQLPPPDEEAAKHSARLCARIAEEIRAQGGAISFEQYMALALYAPGLGYYAAGASKFGAAGDFVTAPEMTPLFGRCLARFVAAVAPGGAYELLEVGAGSGELAAALIPELASLTRAPARYRILEPSPDLRERQTQRLRPIAQAAGVELLFDDDLRGEPLTGVVIANEMLDAIPVQRFRCTADGVREAMVVLGDAGFEYRFERPGDERLSAALHGLEERLGTRLPDGYCSEIAPARGAWVAGLAERLASGVALLIDYGYSAAEYYHPQRVEGTLACHYRHRRHEDPFLWPGLCDITAHVDFTALAESADGAGLGVAGFTTQAHFLLGNGLLDLCAELVPGTPEFLRAAGLVQRLTMPHEMGEAVRVMALAKNPAEPQLPGFADVDLRGRL